VVPCLTPIGDIAKLDEPEIEILSLIARNSETQHRIERQPVAAIER
jgi:hypothetical protein